MDSNGKELEDDMNGNIEQRLFEEMKAIAKFMGETKTQISNLINDVQENVNVTKSVEKEVNQLNIEYKEQQKRVVDIDSRLYVLDNPKNGLINATIDETTKNTATVKILRIIMVTILAGILGTGATLVAKAVGLF